MILNQVFLKINSIVNSLSNYESTEYNVDTRIEIMKMLRTNINNIWWKKIRGECATYVFRGYALQYYINYLKEQNRKYSDDSDNSNDTNKLKYLLSILDITKTYSSDDFDSINNLSGTSILNEMYSNLNLFNENYKYDDYIGNIKYSTPVIPQLTDVMKRFCQCGRFYSLMFAGYSMMVILLVFLT